MSVETRMAEQAVNIATDLAKWIAYKHLQSVARAFEDDMECEPYYTGGTLYVTVTGDKHKLADAVRILRTRDFETSQDPPGAKDPSWCASYYLKDSDRQGYVYLTFCSTVCRRVKVGTEMKVVDIYDIQCGEEAPAEDLPF